MDLNSDDRKISGEVERFTKKTLPEIFNKLFPVLVLAGVILAIYALVITPEEMQATEEALFLISN